MIYFPGSVLPPTWEYSTGKINLKIPLKRRIVMIIGKVVGSVVSTRKNEKLVGSKFMIVEILRETGSFKEIVAVDNVGAGIGELVLVATGSAARIGCDAESSPIDAAIVGIIDSDIGIG